MEYDLEQLAMALEKTPVEDWDFSRTERNLPFFEYNLSESGSVRIMYWDIFSLTRITTIEVRLLRDTYKKIIDPIEEDIEKRTVYQRRLTMSQKSETDKMQFVLFSSLIHRLEKDAIEVEKKRKEAEVEKFERKYNEWIKRSL